MFHTESLPPPRLSIGVSIRQAVLSLLSKEWIWLAGQSLKGHGRGSKGGRGDDFFFEAYLGIASEYAIVEHGKYVI